MVWQIALDQGLCRTGILLDMRHSQVQIDHAVLLHIVIFHVALVLVFLLPTCHQCSMTRMVMTTALCPTVQTSCSFCFVKLRLTLSYWCEVPVGYLMLWLARYRKSDTYMFSQLLHVTMNLDFIIDFLSHLDIFNVLPDLDAHANCIHLFSVRALKTYQLRSLYYLLSFLSTTISANMHILYYKMKLMQPWVDGYFIFTVTLNAKWHLYLQIFHSFFMI